MADAIHNHSNVVIGGHDEELYDELPADTVDVEDGLPVSEEEEEQHPEGVGESLWFEDDDRDDDDEEEREEDEGGGLTLEQEDQHNESIISTGSNDGPSNGTTGSEADANTNRDDCLSNPFDETDEDSGNPFDEGKEEEYNIEEEESLGVGEGAHEKTTTADSSNPFGDDNDDDTGSAIVYNKNHNIRTTSSSYPNDGGAEEDDASVTKKPTKTATGLTGLVVSTSSLLKAVAANNNKNGQQSKQPQVELREAAEALAATGYNPFGSTDDMDDIERRTQVTKSLANFTIASFATHRKQEPRETPEQAARRAYTAQLLELTTLGFDDVYSLNALRVSDGDVEKARKMLTMKLDDPLLATHMLSVWKSPVTLRIGGWLPNVQDELGAFHTAYYISVLMMLSNHSWRIGRRFSEFYKLYCNIYPQLQKAFPRGTEHPFPVSRMGWLQGSSEAQCNERRVSLDEWLKEVVSSSKVMLDDVSRSHIFQFLEFDQNMRRLAQTASLVVSAASSSNTPSVAAGTSSIASRMRDTQQHTQPQQHTPQTRQQQQQQRSASNSTLPPPPRIDMSAIPSSATRTNKSKSKSEQSDSTTTTNITAGGGNSSGSGIITSIPAALPQQQQGAATTAAPSSGDSSSSSSSSSSFNSWFARRTSITAGSTLTASTTSGFSSSSSSTTATSSNSRVTEKPPIIANQSNNSTVPQQQTNNQHISPIVDPSSFAARRLKPVARPAQQS